MNPAISNVSWAALAPYLVLGGGALLVMLVDAMVKTTEGPPDGPQRPRAAGDGVTVVSVKIDPGAYLSGAFSVSVAHAVLQPPAGGDRHRHHRVRERGLRATGTSGPSSTR
ncbi:MAG: hypothetical protein R3D98_12575 [Candidatus Krumholzibacteriia bacterium]